MACVHCSHQALNLTSHTGTRQFQSQLHVSDITCDASAPIASLIISITSRFHPSSSSPAPPFPSDPLATHIPSLTLPQTLSIRFAGGGALDHTTAILCCRVTSPVTVQGFEAECDGVHVQWYRLVPQLQRTPAVKIGLTSVRCEYAPSIDAAAHESSPASSSSPPQPRSLGLSKLSVICDGSVQVQHDASKPPALPTSSHTPTPHPLRSTAACAATGTPSSSLSPST